MQIIRLTFVLSSLFVLLIQAAPILVPDGSDSFETRDGDIDLWQRAPLTPGGPAMYEFQEREDADAVTYARALVPRGRINTPTSGPTRPPKPVRPHKQDPAQVEHRPNDEQAAPKSKGFMNTIKRFWRKITRKQ